MSFNSFGILFRRIYADTKKCNEIRVFEGYFCSRDTTIEMFEPLLKEQEVQRKGKTDSFMYHRDNEKAEINKKYILVFSYFSKIIADGEIGRQNKTRFEFLGTDDLSDQYLRELRQRYPGIQVDSSWTKKPRTEDDDKFLFDVDESPWWLEKVFLNPKYQRVPGDERFEMATVLSFEGSSKRKIEDSDVEFQRKILRREEEQKEKLSQEIKKMEERYKLLKQILSDKEKLISSVKNDVASQKEQLSTLNDNIDEKKDRLWNLDSDIEEKEKRSLQLSKNIKKEKELLSKLRQEHEAKTKALEEVQKPIHEPKVLEEGEVQKPIQEPKVIEPIQVQEPKVLEEGEVPKPVQEPKVIEPIQVQEPKVLEEGEVPKPIQELIREPIQVQVQESKIVEPIPEQAPEDFTIEDFPAEKRLLLVLKGQKYTFKGDTRFSTMSTFLDIKTKP